MDPPWNEKPQFNEVRCIISTVAAGLICSPSLMLVGTVWFGIQVPNPPFWFFWNSIKAPMHI